MRLSPIHPAPCSGRAVLFALAGVMLFTAAAGECDLRRRWENLYPGAPSFGYDVAVDAAGDVYSVGSHLYDSVGGDSFVAVITKISGDYSLPRWTLTVNGDTATGYEDSARGVAVEPSTQDVIVGGVLFSLSGTGEGPDAWLARFHSDGSTVWSITVDGPRSSTDVVEAVAIGPGGMLFAAGRQEVTAGNSDIWVARYSSAGVLQNQYIYPDFYDLDGSAMDVAVDQSGSVYVVGYQDSPGNLRDIWIGKFSPSLAYEWSLTINGAASSTDYATGVALDSSGNIVVSGSQRVMGDLLDIWIAKFDGAGAAIWSRTLDGGIHDNDEGGECAVSPSGRIYACGYVDRPTDVFSDVWVGVFSSDGTLEQEFTRDYAGTYDRANALALRPDDWIAVAGTVSRSVGVAGFYTAMYQDWVATPAVVDEVQVFPNPYRPASGGRYDAPGLTFRALLPGSDVRIYTLTGKLVAEITDTDLDGQAFWDVKNGKALDVASGVYIYVSKSKSGTAKRGKVVIIK